MGTTPMARHDVVQSQVAGLAAAVLAGVAVSNEDFPPRQPNARPGPPYLVLEADDRRRAIVLARRPDHLVVVLENFGPQPEHQPEGTRQIAHVERLIVLIKD